MSEWGKSKRTNGLASWGTCRAAARERRERRAISRALHGGVEVAAAGGSGRVARRGERKREGNGRWRKSDATRGTAQQAGGGRAGPPRQRVALHSGGGQRSRADRQAGGGRKD